MSASQVMAATVSGELKIDLQAGFVGEAAAKALNHAFDQTVGVTALVDGEAPAPDIVVGVGDGEGGVTARIPGVERVDVDAFGIKQVFAGEPRAGIAGEWHCPPLAVDLGVVRGGHRHDIAVYG